MLVLLLPFANGFALFVGTLFISLPRTTSTPISPAATSTPVLPQGITNHGDPELLCSPSDWNDIAIFILANFTSLML